MRDPFPIERRATGAACAIFDGDGRVLRQGAGHADIGQPAAEVVVEVAGNTAAFALDQLGAFESLDAGLVPPAQQANNAGPDGGDDPQPAQRGKPPGLPEKREHGERQHCACLTPQPVVVARRHVKLVFAGRQPGIIRRAAGSGVEPGRVHFVKPKSEPYSFRGAET